MLRHELKQFEAAFRHEHARDPTPADIKARPDIANKYKQYQREKAAARQPVASTSSSAAKSDSNRTADPFTTPTKPSKRTTSRRPERPASASRDAPTVPSSREDHTRDRDHDRRDKEPSSSTTTTAPGTLQERYVVANSPSKLRALAALHSSSGSPNKRSSEAAAGSVPPPFFSDTMPAAKAGPSSASSQSRFRTRTTTTTSSVSAAPPLFFPVSLASSSSSSPQKKAPNPFASPQKGAFGAFERAEREKLRLRRAAELDKQKQRHRAASGGGGVLGKKAATRAGAGWGKATTVPGMAVAESLDRATAMDLDKDEVDDFFGGGGRGGIASTSAQKSTQRDKQSDRTDDEEDDEDDEALGPSPMKPLTTARPLLGAEGHRSNDEDPFAAAAPAARDRPRRPFKPLMPDPFLLAPATATTTTKTPQSRSTNSARQSRSPATTAAAGLASSLSSTTTRPIPFLVPLQRSEPLVSVEGRTNVVVPQKRTGGSEVNSFHADLRPADEPGSKRKKASRGGATATQSGQSASKNGKGPGGKGKGAGKEQVGDGGKLSESVKPIATSADMVGEMILDLEEYDTEKDEEEEEEVEGAVDAEDDMEEGDKTSTKRRRKKATAPAGQIVIRDKAWMARQRALEREERYAGASLPRANEDDGDDDRIDDTEGNSGLDILEGGAGGHVDEEDAIDVLATDANGGRLVDDEPFCDVSLFTTTRLPDLLALPSASARSRSRTRSASPATRRADDQAALAASLPADLAALLSLRSTTSPRKSSSSKYQQSHPSLAKERQVARVLGEPVPGESTRAPRRAGRGGGGVGVARGLLDLANEGEDEDKDREGNDSGGGTDAFGGAGGGTVDDDDDDDWDEEVDGWEGPGEAMDGYYSGVGEDDAY
ncbi:hypothetical protein JCM3774_003679 [Rhodotorula dairenensis]